jgi:hypothetical protein
VNVGQRLRIVGARRPQRITQGAARRFGCGRR